MSEGNISVTRKTGKYTNLTRCKEQMDDRRQNKEMEAAEGSPPTRPLPPITLEHDRGATKKNGSNARKHEEETITDCGKMVNL